MGEQLSLLNLNYEIPNPNKKAYKIVITEVPDSNNDGAVDLADVEFLIKNKKNTLVSLKGDGDFRSKECIELLKESDIVVTNPPFSLFREYIAQLIEYKKQFLIIGNINALSYKEIFPLLRDNKVWLGQSIHSGDRKFLVPKTVFDEDKVKGKLETDENGNKYVRVVGVRWYTNLDNDDRHEGIIPYKKYSPLEYRKYYNYDAINVDLCSKIPKDWDGRMGVPISLMDKYNPEQFKIIGLGISSSGLEIGVKPYTPEHKKYRKEVQHKGAVDGDLYMVDENGHPDVPYARIIIEKVVKESEE